MTPRLLIATRSTGKRPEIEGLLASAPVQIVFPDDLMLERRREEETIESGTTFTENATLKALHFARRSGVPTAAEDSGIEVDFLKGEPGIHSKRFAVSTAGSFDDHANNEELLRRLEGVPEDERTARYRCVISYVEDVHSEPMIFEGLCTGRITKEYRGTSGFGYDPLFWSDDLGKTFGEATAQEKAAVSHRGRAFNAFAEWLGSRAESPL